MIQEPDEHLVVPFRVVYADQTNSTTAVDKWHYLHRSEAVTKQLRFKPALVPVSHEPNSSGSMRESPIPEGFRRGPEDWFELVPVGIESQGQ